MKKLLLIGASALAMALALGPATANAAPPPTTAICVGAGSTDGSFEPQSIGTGNLSILPLGLSQDLCLVLSRNGAADWVEGLVGLVTGLEPPKAIDIPDVDELKELLDTIGQIDPSNPLAALLLLDVVCSKIDPTLCTKVLGSVLGAPIPLGNLTLKGTSGNCWDNEQSGTGTVFGGGSDFLQLEWTTNYTDGGPIGMISGKATSFGGDEWPLSGVIGLGCGAGAKVLIAQIG